MMLYSVLLLSLYTTNPEYINNVHGYWLCGPMRVCLVAELRRLHACLPKCDICMLGCQTVQCPSLVAKLQSVVLGCQVAKRMLACQIVKRACLVARL